MAKKKATKKKATKKKASSKKKSSASSRGRNNRKKGHDFERAVANELRGIFPDAERELEYQQSQIDGRDLKGTRPLAIQCKNNAAYASINTIRQVKPCDEYPVPVLVTKGARVEPVAVLYFKDFVNLLRAVDLNKILPDMAVDRFVDVVKNLPEPKLADVNLDELVQVLPTEDPLKTLGDEPATCKKCNGATVRVNFGGRACPACKVEYVDGDAYCQVCDFEVDDCECKPEAESVPAGLSSFI